MHVFFKLVNQKDNRDILGMSRYHQFRSIVVTKVSLMLRRRTTVPNARSGKKTVITFSRRKAERREAETTVSTGSCKQKWRTPQVARESRVIKSVKLWFPGVKKLGERLIYADTAGLELFHTYGIVLSLLLMIIIQPN